MPASTRRGPKMQTYHNHRGGLSKDGSQIKLKTMRVGNIKREHHKIGMSNDMAPLTMKIMHNDSTIEIRSPNERRSQDFIGLKQRKLEPIELTSVK